MVKDKLASIISGLFVFFSVFIALILVSPKTTLAQGKFRCGVSSGACVAINAVGLNCEQGYMPDQNYCDTWNNNLTQCPLVPPQDCILDPNQSTSPPTTTPQTCYLCFTDSDPLTPNRCGVGSCTSPGSKPSYDACLANCTGAVDERGKLKCDGRDSINTAIGCIPYGDINKLATFFLRWALGFAGGIAIVLIAVAGFQMMTSAGDPRKLQAGQELLSSAIMGLLLIIFSAFILRVIGVDLLGIL